ncbi:DUF4397 domain-containing protein [Halobacteria archaeon AArc-m2/3/4]|uniref:DUF4397 domain-containing protein n=1 Tax=Natronoglomus mannanivorans TaxID=2979990 RepID=A0ABT2QDA5_9EURY|nr:DUF4397 domain-containing protein [Halobacteria archaeon AArc-m2/3/4]
MTTHNRRTILKAAGSATVVGILAGCLSGDDDSTDDEMGENGDDRTGGDDHEDENGNGEYEENTDTDHDDDAERGSVRVAHLSPDAPNVDVFVDGDAVLEDVPFRAVSDYLELPVGTANVTITAAGDPDTVAFDDDVEIAEGDATVAALGELSGENQQFAPALLTDDRSDPGEMARVRLVHASPDAPAVDVTVAGDPLFENVAFGEAATVEVPADAYELEVRPATETADGDVVETFDVEPAAGGVYTVFAVGYLAPDDAPAHEPFDLEVVSDADWSDTDGTKTADLRVAHLSPDAPNVDVFVDGDAVLEDVPFRAVSDYLELDVGHYDVMVTAAGDADTVVFDETLELEAASYSAVALGELADENQPFAVEAFGDDRSDPGEMARVRLVHASPDAPAVDVTVAGDPLFEDVAFGEAATVEVPADAYELEIRPATETADGDVVATFDVEPAAGGVYTAFAVGYLMPEDAPAHEAFDLEVVDDGVRDW